MENYCFSCHDGDSEKGDIRLDDLGGLSLDARLDRLNKVYEQLYIHEMPPAKKEQPSDGDRQQLIEWVAGELRKHNASKFEGKLRYPA